MTKHIGILTAGGGSPGLNAAICGVGKAAQSYYDMQMIGFMDGFRGLVDNRTTRLDGGVLSGILTQGGTILGTSRDKPHRMMFAGGADVILLPEIPYDIENVAEAIRARVRSGKNFSIVAV
ncbi:MAG: 6-phosphofructokinase [Chromatiales bacterium]|nr:6-phosphofructokinase [Gammaproteobacteria bacterium]